MEQDAAKIAQGSGVGTGVFTIQQAFNTRLEALSRISDTERLRLALVGAKTAVFDWTISDDVIRWDGAQSVLPSNFHIEHLNSGHKFRTWLDSPARGRLSKFVEKTSSPEPVFQAEFEASTGASREWFQIVAVRLPGPDGQAERVTGVVRDITEQKTSHNRLSYLAAFDELTGQLNRTRLREELTLALQNAIAAGHACAFVVAAIDNLAVINETYGFDIADEVIVGTGLRLEQILGSGDVIGRASGNKFGVVLRECDEIQMADVAEAMRAAIQRDMIDTRAGSVAATVSIGAVWLPRGASTSQEAMLRAEEALERAKRRGRNGFATFTPSEKRKSERSRMVATGEEIVSALNENRLVFAYQPIVNAVTRQAEHYECLLRIERKDGTIASAGEFIPAAETLGLVRHLDRRALEIAVAQLYRHRTIKLSVNVSGTTAGDSSWLQSFITYVRENREVAERMTVELTETAALHAFEENAQFVSRLRDMGCRVAIDDFGAGYTSFRNLHNLCVDIVKIDGSYIKNLSRSPDNQLFVRTLVDLAKNFQLETVAEWVGSEQDAALLSDYGVDYFQGYYFGEPAISPAWASNKVASTA